MKTITVIFALIFACSLVLITDANQQERRSKNALRAQLLEYLLAAKRNELLQNLEQNLEREIVRQVRNRLNGDDQEESDAHENTHSRRKFVGLNDEPY